MNLRLQGFRIRQTGEVESIRTLAFEDFSGIFNQHGLQLLAGYAICLDDHSYMRTEMLARCRDLKHIVRTSIEHSFLPGESLWRAHDNFTAVISACGKDSLGNDKPSSSCAAFLESSEKAAQQWELERRFRKFEFEL